MDKFILVSPKNRTAYNFRGDLIKEIIAHGFKVIVTGPNQEGVERITSLGAEFYEIPMDKNGINPFSDIKYLYSLYKLFKSEKPVATLGYTIKPVIYGSIAAKIAGVKNITSMVTGIGYLFASNSLKAKIIRFISSMLYKIGFGCANNVIFQNNDDLNDFTRLKLCSKDKTYVVNGSGVNLNRFKPADLPNKITFFFLGRFIYSKGIMDFLEAAKLLKSQYLDCRFVILGKFERMNDAVPQADIERYIDDGVVEHFPETDNIALYYEQTSVFVLPTYYREGTPRVILEAMACGRPIITTNTPGCKETVINGVNGYFVKPKDPKDLAEKCEVFIKDNDKIKKMGKESLKICREKYDVSKVNAQMLKILNI